MAKYIKFALSPSGTLVHRNNGNAYRGKYTIRTGPTGVKTVYGKDGRKIGTIGKPTKAEKARIDKKDKTRVARREREARRAILKLNMVDYIATEYGFNVPDNGWRATAIAKRAWYEIRDIDKPEFLTVAQRENMNYASILDQAVNAGVMTVEEANERYADFLDGDKSKRSDLWDEIDSISSEKGWKPSSPPATNFGGYYSA